MKFSTNNRPVRSRTKLSTLLIALILIPITSANAQGILGGHVTGNIQIDGQTSSRDTLIGANAVEEGLLLNARADILYTNGNFSAGMRFEAYQNPLPGFNIKYKGQGIANYFASYNGSWLSVTFYEQFGNGMILRAYEDRYLGMDNAILGFKLAVRPVNGLTLKGVFGKQRYYWEWGDGLVRGVDAELNFNSIIKSFAESKTRITIGGGFVSKYEKDEVILAENPEYKLNLPHNIGAGSVRLDLSHGGFNLQAEYARKGQDPNVINNYIYREGQALFISAGYSQRGLSANIQAKRVDNMCFKSVRSETGEMLYINYIPSITKQHTYAFLSMYPYATQATGEMGLQGDVMYKIKKGTALGGKYGTDLHLNASVITGIETNTIGGRGTEGYSSHFFKPVGLYYADINFEFNKKLSQKLKLALTYGFIRFNPIVEGHEGNIHTNNVVVADLTWKVNPKHVLRFEAEWLASNSVYDRTVDDKRCGDWLMGLIEYNFTSKFFVSLSDQWCYKDGIGNYYNISLGYTHKATRIQVGYGKQREGIICIGGVCRQVPAANGLTFSLSTSF